MQKEYTRRLAQEFREKPKWTTDSDLVRRQCEQLFAFIVPYYDPSTPLEDVVLKPWLYIKGSKESVRISDVQQSILSAKPEDITKVMNANKKLPPEKHFFVNFSNIEHDIYIFHIMLQNPDAYVTSVEAQIPKKTGTRASVTVLKPPS